MSKDRRTITLSKEANSYLSQESVNASGLIDRLVRQYMNTGKTEDAVRSAELEQQVRQDMAIEEAANVLLRDREAYQLTPGNPAVRNHASKAGMSPAGLIEALEEYEADE